MTSVLNDRGTRKPQPTSPPRTDRLIVIARWRPCVSDLTHTVPWHATRVNMIQNGISIGSAVLHDSKFAAPMLKQYVNAKIICKYVGGHCVNCQKSVHWIKNPSTDWTCEVFNEWYLFEGSSKWVPCIKHFQTNVNRRFLLLFFSLTVWRHSWRSPYRESWKSFDLWSVSVINMHFVHFANVIGCNNMLMLKVCNILEHLFYFILHVREA